MNISSAQRKAIVALVVAFAIVLAVVVVRVVFAEGSGSEGGSKTHKVGRDGATFMVGDIEVRIPAGAVPEGTEVSAQTLTSGPPKNIGGVTDFEALGQGLDLRFEGGLQPERPIEVSVPAPADPTAVAFVLQHEGAKPELVAAEQRDGRVYGEIPHLSGIWPVKFDAAQIARDVTTWLLQSLGLEQPEPSCTKDEPTINEVKYRVAQPAEAWVCLGDRDGALKVTVSSNSVHPFILATKPKPKSSTPTTSLDVTTALFAAVANRMQRSGRSVVAPDVSETLLFDPRPTSDITLGFAQSPDLLYGQILLAAASQITGGFGSKVLARLDDLKCLGSVIDVTRADLSVDQAVAFTGAFFDCLGPLVGELPGPHRVAIAAVFAVPQLFAGTALGLMREVTGRGRFTTTISALRLTRPPITTSSGDATCSELLRAGNVDGAARLIVANINAKAKTGMDCYGDESQSVVITGKQTPRPLTTLMPCAMTDSLGYEAMTCVATTDTGRRVTLGFNAGSAGDLLAEIRIG